MPRRDAHTMNWLVSDDRLLAVDFDCVGWRPLGYELAQLTEDDCCLPVDDWETRERIVEAYRDALIEFDVPSVPSAPQVEAFYAAGLIARATWLLSNLQREPSAMRHGGELIAAVAKRFRGTPTGQVAEDLSQFWAAKIGTATDAPTSQLSQASRMRISRAMAFHLRHDPDAAVDRGGWMHVEELAVALRAEGHKVTPDQILLISGAMGEPRFERDGFDIRARYGHSTRTEINYEQRRPPAQLYHATPLANLGSIIEAQAGLRKGARNWVHLSEDPVVALGAARRQSKPVVLMSIQTNDLSGVVYAAHTTWLAPQVPLDLLAIVPLRSGMPRGMPTSSTTT
jgi:RNA:NAD 2'-phosphotransferase (TPT1/KptA family)